MPARKGARAAEWDGLENRCLRKGTVGSNPTPSADRALSGPAEANPPEVRFRSMG